MKDSEKKVGLINPNIFAARHLQYKVRFAKAPSVSETFRALKQENIFNSYWVRGEYDVVLVGLESDSFLFRAATDKKIEELNLQDPLTCVVDQFLKYHGCLVPALNLESIRPIEIAEICQQLFYLSKNWNSDFVSSEVKERFRKLNLLMAGQEGEVYEKEPAIGGRERSDRQNVIVRLGFYGRPSAEEETRFHRFIKESWIPHPNVRSCYRLKLPLAFHYMIEVVGSPAEIDETLVGLQEKCGNDFPELKVFTRSETVMKKVSDGQMNVLASMQTKPELVEHVRERLLAPLLNMDEKMQAELIHFMDKSEDFIRQIPMQEVRDKFFEVLAEFQIAFYLNRASVLQDAVKLLDRELLNVMVRRFAQKFQCPSTNEEVVRHLKKEGFPDHTATCGNLYLTFVKTFSRQPSSLEGDAVIFGKFNEFYTQTVYSARSQDKEDIPHEDRKQIEELFCAVTHLLPNYL